MIMWQDKYISLQELEQVQIKCGQQIVDYLKLREELRDYYETFKFMYPYTSENNFRDAWFHYRKIYQQRSSRELICQTAAFDEHIQRAEKDAIVYLMQEIFWRLEWWYLRIPKQAVERLTLKQGQLTWIENNIHMLGNKPVITNWVYLLKKNFSAYEFANACVYVIKEFVWSEEFEKTLQKLIHSLKNKVLNIRIGGADILRVEAPGDYLRICEGCLDEVTDFCNQYSFVQLIAMTSRIADVVDKDIMSNTA